MPFHSPSKSGGTFPKPPPLGKWIAYLVLPPLSGWQREGASNRKNNGERCFSQHLLRNNVSRTIFLKKIFQVIYVCAWRGED